VSETVQDRKVMLPQTLIEIYGISNSAVVDDLERLSRSFI